MKMEINLLEFYMMKKSKEKVFMFGLMVKSIGVTLKMMKFKDLEDLTIHKEHSIQDNFKTEKLMELD